MAWGVNKRLRRTVWLRTIREKNDSRVAVELTEPEVESCNGTGVAIGSEEGGEGAAAVAKEVVHPISCGDFPRMQRRYRRQWWIWLVVFAGVSALGWTFVGRECGWGVAGFSILALAILAYEFSKKLGAYYKANIVPQFVEFFCEKGTYEPEAGIGQRTFNASNLFSATPDRYTTEDLIQGWIGKTKFCFAEVHAQEKRTVYTKNGTRTTWIDIFRGFFFVADFNKHFQGQTTMVPNFWGAKWLAGRKRVLLENQQLMKRFLVCSTDQVEARYILTPGLMERIMGLWKRYPGKLSISFTGSCIMIARACSKDHYEIGLWNSLSKCIVRDTEAVKGLTAIVEELNMNTRIWTKE